MDELFALVDCINVLAVLVYQLACDAAGVDSYSRDQ